jgi:hypothetical protein
MFHHPVALIILTIKGITMTSTSIYTAIDPTYLYIKQHSITGLKYFGKTIKDPYTYNGSGKRWCNHIKVHGKEHIVTLWVSEPYTDTSIAEFALKFSAENDIVNSKKWANLIPENGLGGGAPFKCRKHTDESKATMSEAKRGKSFSDEHKANISTSKKGNPLSKEHKAKLSAIKMGEPKPQKQITCPHCGKTGGNNMKRYHFDKCKLASKA